MIQRSSSSDTEESISHDIFTVTVIMLRNQHDPWLHQLLAMKELGNEQWFYGMLARQKNGRLCTIEICMILATSWIHLLHGNLWCFHWKTISLWNDCKQRHVIIMRSTWFVMKTMACWKALIFLEKQWTYGTRKCNNYRLLRLGNDPCEIHGFLKTNDFTEKRWKRNNYEELLISA